MGDGVAQRSAPGIRHDAHPSGGGGHSADSVGVQDTARGTKERGIYPIDTHVEGAYARPSAAGTGAGRAGRAAMTNAAASWRGSTWERVCEECFGGDQQRMLAHAQEYSPEKSFLDGNLHLGKRFREIIGTRNRTTWWARARELLEELAVEQPAREIALDVGPILAALRRGQQVRLTEGDEVVATLVPPSHGN